MQLNFFKAFALFLNFESEPPTENDCCSVLMVNSEECSSNGTWGGKDVYSCASNPLKVIFHFAGNWFVGFDGLPQGSFCLIKKFKVYKLSQDRFNLDQWSLRILLAHL